MPDSISSKDAGSIMRMLLELFDDCENHDVEILNWLSRKNVGLNNRAPIDVMYEGPEGVAQVKKLIVSLMHGIPL